MNGKRTLLAFALAVLVLTANAIAFSNKAKHVNREQLTAAKGSAWIRINQLGYTPTGIKVAVWGSKGTEKLKRFELVDATTNKVVFKGKAGQGYGAYGPFKESYRLNFTAFTRPGSYYLKAGLQNLLSLR